MSRAKRVRKARMKKRQDRNALKAGMYFAWVEYDTAVGEFSDIVRKSGIARLEYGH